MKPTSERMLRTAEKRIRTPAIWTIFRDYIDEVKQIEKDKQELVDFVRHVRKNDYWTEWNKLAAHLREETT